MKEIIFVFLLYSFIGTILHFTYNLSNNNIVVGIFSAVNESVWEHIKILLTPIFIYNSICYILKYQTNYYIMLLTELLTAIFGIIILYKLKILLFNNKYKILNIFIFYIVSFLASLLGYIIKNPELLEGAANEKIDIK